MPSNPEPGLVGREVAITRTFDAPRALVFATFTEGDRMKEWWGPNGFTAPLCESDARPGGKLRIHMRGPDGTVYPMGGVYTELIAPERVVTRSWPEDERGEPMFEILTTVSFEESGGNTTLALHARVTKAGPDAEFMIDGMREGWSQSLDRLGKAVATAR